MKKYISFALSFMLVISTLLLCSCSKDTKTPDSEDNLNLIYSIYYYLKQDINDILSLMSSDTPTDNIDEIKVKYNSIKIFSNTLLFNLDSLSDESLLTNTDIELSKDHIIAISETINDEISDIYASDFSSQLTKQFHQTIMDNIKQSIEKRIKILDSIFSNESDTIILNRDEVENICQTYETTEYVKSPDIPDSNASALPDYSDFGFSNIHDKELMNVWIEVNQTFFDNSNDAYFVVEIDYATMSFENNTIVQQHWNRPHENEGVYYSKGQDSKGYLWHTNQYTFVNNNILTLYNYKGGASLQIVNKETYGKVPIIECKFITDYSEDTSDGKYIPAYFIDWERSPVAGTYTAIDFKGNRYERNCVKYYVKSSYLS